MSYVITFMLVNKKFPVSLRSILLIIRFELLFVIFLILACETAIADNVDKLIADLQNGDRQTRIFAVEELGRIKDDRAVDALLNLIVMKGENWRVKIRAIRLLGEIEDPRVLEELLKVFNDPFLNSECPAIKWNTAIALGKNFNKGSKAVDSLINALDNDNLLIREAVIEALGKINDSKAIPFLISALNDRSFAIKLSAIKAIGNIRDPKAIPFLKRIADDDNDPYIKKEVLSVLEDFSSESGDIVH